MTGEAHSSYATGIVTILGGSYAFFKKGSLASLLGSLLIGGGFIYAGYLIDKGEAFSGHAAACIASNILLALGISRYMTAGKLMPSGPMMVIGLISNIYHFRKAYEWYK